MIQKYYPEGVTPHPSTLKYDKYCSEIRDRTLFFLHVIHFLVTDILLKVS